MSDPLKDAERKAELPPLLAAGWHVDSTGTRISKTYKFGDFIEAFGFMTRAAIHAEKLNHHPEWSNVYKTVEVALTTHDVGGLSMLDIKLAQRMDGLAA